MIKLNYSTITPIPDTEPEAIPSLWNTRYTEIDSNFSTLANYSSFGVCGTAAGTQAKTVTIPNFSLAAGARVIVKFQNTNTHATATLNVSSTGAKPLWWHGAQIGKNRLQANHTYEFVYNGTQWELVGTLDVSGDYLPLAGGTVTGNLAVSGTLTQGGKAVAQDDAVVHLAGTETVTGAKTFSGATTVTGTFKSNSLLPNAANTYSLGSSSATWKNVYAATFTGDLTGTAAKATADASGNNIASTYAKLASANAFAAANTFGGATTFNGRVDANGILYVKNVHLTDGTYDDPVMTNVLTASGNGNNVAIGANSSTFITSGEARNHITADNGFSASAENIQLLADTNIYFRTALNSGWNEETGAILTSTNFRPLGSAGTFTLGTVANPWGALYAGNFYHQGDQISFNAQDYAASAIHRSANTGVLALYGGTYNQKDGATIYLNGMGKTAGTGDVGDFVISATNGSAVKYLRGSYTNGLTWHGKALAIDESVVHLDGEESVIGLKSFASGQSIVNTALTRGTKPAKNQYLYIAMAGASGSDTNARFGTFATGVYTSGAVSTYLSAYQNTEGTTTAAQLSVTYPASGDPYASAPSTPAGSSGTQIVTADFLTSGYLPLSGGTMTGMIKKASWALANTANTGFVGIQGGTNTTSWLAMYAAGDSDFPGCLRVKCSDGKNTSYLALYPNKTATWGGDNLATQPWVATQLASYLPLAGGTMTGVIKSGIETTLSATRSTGNVWAARAERSDKDTAICFGIGSAGVNRGIYDTSTSKWMVYSDGTYASTQLGVTATSDDSDTHLATTGWVKDVLGGGYLPLSGGTMTGSIKRSGIAIANTGATTYTEILGGSTASNGAWLAFYGASSSSYAGCIRGRVYDGSNSRYITLKPDGTFLWGEENVATQEWVTALAQKVYGKTRPTLTVLAGHPTNKTKWLMNVDADKGFSLSHPYTDYDGLIIGYTNDNQNWLCYSYVPVWEFALLIANGKSAGVDHVCLPSGGDSPNWTFDPSTTTTTFLGRGSEDSGIAVVYGVKWS